MRLAWHQGGTTSRQATSVYLLHPPRHTESDRWTANLKSDSEILYVQHGRRSDRGTGCPCSTASSDPSKVAIEADVIREGAHGQQARGIEWRTAMINGILAELPRDTALHVLLACVQQFKRPDRETAQR